MLRVLQRHKLNKKGNIIFVSSIKPNVYGGGEKWFYEVASKLKSIGYKVGLVARPKSKLANKFRDITDNVLELKFGFDFNPLSIIKLRKYFRKQNVDYLILHFNKDVSIAGAAGKMAGVKKIIFRNGYPLLHNKFKHKLLIPFFDHIVTNSLILKKQYQSYGWIKSDKIKTIYNGCDIDNEYLAKINEEKEEITVIAIGRLVKVKRFHWFIKLLSEVKTSYKIKGLIVGDGSERSNLEKLVAESKLNIDFTGEVNSVKEYLAKADILLHVSRNEGIPNVVLEAMASKVPVIATNAGGTGELIDDGENGYLCEVKDYTVIKTKLESMINDSSIRKKFTDSGFEKIRHCFTWDNTIEKLEKLFNE